MRQTSLSGLDIKTVAKSLKEVNSRQRNQTFVVVDNNTTSSGNKIIKTTLSPFKKIKHQATTITSKNKKTSCLSSEIIIEEFDEAEELEILRKFQHEEAQSVDIHGCSEANFKFLRWLTM